MRVETVAEEMARIKLQSMGGLVKESPYPLPEDLGIPRFHGAYASKAFDDSSILLLEPSTQGWLTVIMEDGKGFRVEKPEDILLLFPSKYNWVYSRFNEIDCITKPLSREQRVELRHLNKTTITLDGCDFTLGWIPGTGKLTLMRGGATVTTRYLINAAAFTTKSTVLKDFGEIRDLVHKLQILDKFSPINLLSLASTAKNYILGFSSREFQIVNKLSIEDLRFIHSCYKGPRMETRYLGTLEGRENIDMRKAYLNALANTPAFHKNVVKIYRGPKKFFEDAHPGSAYQVKVNVPASYSTFPPIPLKLDGVRYPHGEFVAYLSKPYLDLLVEMGDIPFEILDSVQFIMLDPKNLPFKKGLRALGRFEEDNKEKLSPINLKSLHYTLVGHFLHYHQEIDGKTGEIKQVATNDYHPSLSLAMQGMVATELWKMSQVHNTDAIRVDALTGRSLPDVTSFKRAGTGTMTFLTASLKDKPGETLYRDHIYAARDKSFVTFSTVSRKSFLMGYLDNSTGRLIDTSARVAPTAGNRYTSKPKYVGELLDGSLETVIPTVDHLLKEDIPQCRVNEGRLDLYLRLFHPTQP